MRSDFAFGALTFERTAILIADSLPAGTKGGI